MEVDGVTIPGWAVALLIPSFVGIIWWLIYLTRMTMDNKQSIAINQANDNAVGKLIEDLKVQVAEVRSEMGIKTDKISDKVDRLFEMIALSTTKK